MHVSTDLELIHDLVTGVGLGQARVRAARVAQEAIDKTLAAMKERDAAVRRAIETGSAALAAEALQLLAVTDGLFKHHTLLCTLLGARRLSDELHPRVRATLREVRTLAGLGIPQAYLPADVVEIFRDASEASVNEQLSASQMLASSVRGPSPAAARAFLARVTATRLWALHALVLASIAAAEATDDAGSADAAGELRAAAEAQVRTLRDRLHELARELRRREIAGPGWSSAVWLALDAAESWIAEQRTATATACAAATAPSASNALKRDAAAAYDAQRTLLALVAGAWTVLRARATEDASTLERFAAAAALKPGSAAADPPRSTLTQAASAPQGTLVEVADVVTSAQITAGGPAPRSVLELGAGERRLTVLVPFIAVDSFGIQPGIWLQARGELFPDGKDALAGPVLQVRRIQRELDAGESFFDHLVFEGRKEFELRPGGFDLSAGRLAGDEATLAELGLRAQQGRAT
jgi:hypothetical protein